MAAIAVVATLVARVVATNVSAFFSMGHSFHVKRSTKCADIAEALNDELSVGIKINEIRQQF